MEENLPNSLKLNFSTNTLGCYGLILAFLLNLKSHLLYAIHFISNAPVSKIYVLQDMLIFISV